MRRWGAVLCAIWCIAACAIIGVRTMGGRAFDADIQSLLPQNALEPVIRGAITEASNATARRVAILVTADGPGRAQEGARDLEKRLVDAGLFTPDRADGEALGRWLYANRNALLCETDPARFDANAVVRRSLALIYAPTTPLTGALLSHDPFLLTLQLAQCLSPAQGGGEHALVSGSLTQSAFRLDVQDQTVAAFNAWRAAWPDVSAARAGAVFFAEEGARQARGEFTLIAGVSSIAILMLLLACFRRPEAVLGTLAVTIAGGAGSLAAALLVFPAVHVLVFVFGSALIGVTSDYALHYLATGPQTGWAPVKARVARVARPLAVCALSTSLGFASLAVFGVAIFTQVAVFSVAGILTAWWFTVTLLPLMDVRAKNAETLSAWWRKLEAPFLAFRWTRVQSIVGAVIVLATLGVGVARFGVRDDVRQFQPRSPVLVAEEAAVRDALGFSASPVFLLSYGATADAARRNEEGALARLPESAARDVLALSRFDPSVARRAENTALLRAQLYAPHLAERVALLGVEHPDPFAEGPPPARPRTIAALEGQTGATHFLIAPLGADASAAVSDGSGVVRVDPAARYSQAFARYRELAGWAVAGAFGVCALIVLALYRTPRALIVLGAPAIGAVMALAVPAALGSPLSFFTVAALFVVMGAGIDHSVFLFEAGETDGQPKELVIFLAALTTILSMGLLGLSGTYPVQSFGIAVAAGVTAAYVFSFVPAGLAKKGRARAGGEH